MSLFISFEGGEGSGKTTQAGILARRLEEAGFRVTSVHEPGTTDLGQQLRELLKRESSGDRFILRQTELLLFAAARAELVGKVIKPALRQDHAIVVADRYADSTTAYQGYGRRLNLGQVRVVNSLATQGVNPDLTFLLDCPVQEGLCRAGARQTLLEGFTDGDGSGRRDREGTRRFEVEPLQFHQRVRKGYLKIARKEPARWCVLDALAPPSEISDSIWSRVEHEIDSRLDAGSDGRSHSLPLWADEPDTQDISQSTERSPK